MGNEDIKKIKERVFLEGRVAEINIQILDELRKRYDLINEKSLFYSKQNLKVDLNTAKKAYKNFIKIAKDDSNDFRDLNNEYKKFMESYRILRDSIKQKAASSA